MESTNLTAPAARGIDALGELEDDEILSLNRASQLTGIGIVALRTAIENGRLDARFGRVAPPPGAGRTGTPAKWQIRVGAFRAFLDACKPCLYEPCEKLGVGPTGCCSGPHAQAVLMRGVRRPGVGAKISAATKEKKRGPRPESWKRSIRAGLESFWSSSASEGERQRRKRMAKDSQWQFEHTIGRWGHRQESAKRAARKLAHELQRRRGGRPRAEERTGRWRAMYEGRDPELESMVDPSLDGENGLSRYRLLVWLDWQHHPEDWKRDRYPASRAHPDEIDPAFLRAGEDRVRKALGKRLQIR